MVLIAEAAWLVVRWAAPLPDVPAAGVAQGRVTLDPALAIGAFASDAAGVASDGWTLVGLRKHPDPRRSTAVLVRDGGPQRVYAPGEWLDDGLRLRDVGIDHVVLAGPRGTRRLVLARRATPAAAAPPSSPEHSTDRAIGGFRGDDLAREAGLVPRIVDGRVAGFTLIERGGGRALRAAGLRAGDVLLAVNGDALTPERLASVPDAFRGGPLELTIERDGRRQTLSLSMESP